MHSPLVSVIIPIYNAAPYIASAIDSVLAQTLCNYEIIIVDDGSTDNTKSIIADYVDKYPGIIKYLYQENRGPSGARNKGIKEALGSFISFLDADDTWMPNKTETQLRVMQTSPSVGMVSSAAEIIDELGIKIKVAKSRKYTRKDLIKNLSIRNVISGGTPSVLIRKECFEKTGLFDESLTVAEDWDMWLRIAKKYDCAYIDEPLVRIKVRNKSQSCYGERNLKNELRLLGKIYSTDDFRGKSSAKIKAYARCYYRAALAYLSNGDIKKARICFWKSAMDPFLILEKSYAALFFRFLFGERVFRMAKGLKRKNVLSNI